jgi:16S rRNA (uracil1498-N3)-methyltransferase
VEGPRFFCSHVSPGPATLDADESRHALQSLRLRPGDALTLFDGRGRIAHAVLQETERSANRATVAIEHVLNVPPPTLTLTLIAAACKGPRLTWMIEKCTELGVTRIVLVNFERSVVRVTSEHAQKLRRTALTACKQCRRAWLPEIDSAVDLSDATADAHEGALLIAEPDESAPLLAVWLHAHPIAANHLTAVVGPEGGLTDAELESLHTTGGQLIRLAETILRIETAAVAIAANWTARGALPE